MPELDGLAPGFQAVEPQLADLLTLVQLSDYALELPAYLFAAGPPVFLAESSLDVVEQLLDRVQPRGVLGVQEDIHLKLACRLVDRAVLVDGGVVHEHNDVFVLGLFVSSELRQQSVQEVVEHHCVGSSLCDLGRHHTVLSQSCYHRERIGAVLLGVLLSLDPG